jgi:hypothetical protein
VAKRLRPFLPNANIAALGSLCVLVMLAGIFIVFKRNQELLSQKNLFFNYFVENCFLKTFPIT